MPDRDLELEPHTREVEVDYTGLSLRIPEQVRFRNRLVGHDVNWVEAGTRRQAFYNDLKPGRYVFQVIASNSSVLPAVNQIRSGTQDAVRRET